VWEDDFFANSFGRHVKNERFVDFFVNMHMEDEIFGDLWNFTCANVMYVEVLIVVARTLEYVDWEFFVDVYVMHKEGM